MGLVTELLSEVWNKENKENKDHYVGNATEIRIHPRTYWDLMSDKEVQKHYSIIDGKAYIAGIPLIKTPDVEKWEIII